MQATFLPCEGLADVFQLIPRYPSVFAVFVSAALARAKCALVRMEIVSDCNPVPDLEGDFRGISLKFTFKRAQLRTS